MISRTRNMVVTIGIVDRSSPAIAR
jgi:hypothetical protein